VLKQTTSTIPIVFSIAPDPVGTGLVASLAHPGGNLTGLSVMGTDLTGKRLSLLKEAVPNLSRVALLIDRSLDPNTIKHNISAYSKAAEEIGVVLHPIEAATTDAMARLWSDRCSQMRDRGLEHQRWRTEYRYYRYLLKRYALDC
jgi:putative ABC transport system substrate-binding protein